MQNGVWIGVGTIVSIISFLLYDKLLLFFYVGLIFIVVGLVKMIPTKLEKPQPVHKPTHSQRPISGYHKFCYRCGAVIRTSDNFCSACGVRVL